VPDAMYAGPSGMLFVEYKYLKNLPKKDTTVITTGLSPLQLNWLNQMMDYGHRCVVAIGSSRGIFVISDANTLNENISNAKFQSLLISLDEFIEYICNTVNTNESINPSRKLQTDLERKKT
tara:strand:+ start:2863 stop:3225 length:363 start_codon:yes stop_codon:yes gene_type:complete